MFTIQPLPGQVHTQTPLDRGTDGLPGMIRELAYTIHLESIYLPRCMQGHTSKQLDTEETPSQANATGAPMRHCMGEQLREAMNFAKSSSYWTIEFDIQQAHWIYSAMQWRSRVLTGRFQMIPPDKRNNTISSTTKYTRRTQDSNSGHEHAMLSSNNIICAIAVFSLL